MLCNNINSKADLLQNGGNMINKLITRIKETNAPIVVGLDPMMKFVPEYIKKAAFTEYGETLEGDCGCYL